MTVCCKLIDTSFTGLWTARECCTHTRTHRETERNRGTDTQTNAHILTRHSTRVVVVSCVLERVYFYLLFSIFPLPPFLSISLQHLFFVVDIYCTKRTKELRSERKTYADFYSCFLLSLFDVFVVVVDFLLLPSFKRYLLFHACTVVFCIRIFLSL